MSAFALSASNGGGDSVALFTEKPGSICTRESIFAFRKHLVKLDDLAADDPKRDQCCYVASLDQVLLQYQKWRKFLPNVAPFYAVKCNPLPQVVSILATLGSGFDCASVSEMRSILNLGVPPSRIVFANPVKTPSSLKFAFHNGIRKMTFDCIEELAKIASLVPNAQLILRICSGDATARVTLSKKYGARLKTTKLILMEAKNLGLEVIGTSFHVGTGAQDGNAYKAAIEDSAKVFKQARDMGFHPDLLDIGGGFEDVSFVSFAQIIRDALEINFPPSVRVIAEPGRYMCQNTMHLFAKVIGVRKPMHEHMEAMLYQSDGVYGNFMNVFSEGETYTPKLVSCTDNQVRASGSHKYRIWGPTCDSNDLVEKAALFDREVKMGDWLLYENMGAYTISNTTEFNGLTNDYPIIWLKSKMA